MNSFYDDVGIRIRELREKNRYTREKFAEIAEISPKFLYEIETGQKGFSADTLHRIASGLSVTCDYILYGDFKDEYREEIYQALRLFDGHQISSIYKLLKLIHEIIAKN